MLQCLAFWCAQALLTAITVTADGSLWSQWLAQPALGRTGSARALPLKQRERGVGGEAPRILTGVSITQESTCP